MRCHHRYFLCFFGLFGVMVLLLTTRELWLVLSGVHGGTHKSRNSNTPRINVIENLTALEYEKDCRLYSCFDIFKCNANKHGKINVFVYPSTIFMTNNGKEIFPDTSSEYSEVLKTIKSSDMYTDDPGDACLFIPAMDTLSEIPLEPLHASTAFTYLEKWDNGLNHVIFNMVSNSDNVKANKGMLALDSGKAIVAGADFHLQNFRKNFDVSLPVYNSFTNIRNVKEKDIFVKRRTLLTLFQPYEEHVIAAKLGLQIKRNQMLVLDECDDVPFPDSRTIRCSDDSDFDYPEILKTSMFCFYAPSLTTDKSSLLDALMMGCIPVILDDGSILPFSEVIDWQRISIQINLVHIHRLPKLLREIGRDEIVEKQLQGFYVWKNYFSSMAKITMATLDIISDRLIGNQIRQYERWNDIIPKDKNGNARGQEFFLPPIFFPVQPKFESGFTAVILTYNRIQMLHSLMERLSRCKSLAKIVVVWNNVNTDPPKDSAWPKLSKPWTLIRQKTNRLSNRFYPYKEIETEAVLAIDDDILMLTTDEVEFAFRTWLEFHDRLVGFPGRFHTMDSSHQASHHHRMTFRYESEWSNDVSMVLTGAAFYHKIYNYYYTYVMPAVIRKYVDQKMNCEDIAMNFLIANLTRKAPIKVTARKRFKCSQCHGNESLWSESSHFVKRSECLSIFTDLFGYMPLKSVEFRADPVLFQEKIPLHLQEFRDIGTM